MALKAAFAAVICHLAGAQVYSKLAGQEQCQSYKIPDIASKAECFAAADQLGLTVAWRLQLDGLGFNGCALNTADNVLIYSVTAVRQNTALATLAYLCKGIPTTTSTFTSTTTKGIFAKLQPNSRCADEGVPDVATADQCRHAVNGVQGLAGKAVMVLNNLGFTGCAYNNAADTVIFSETAALSANANLKLTSLEYVCAGLPTTTLTTTRTRTTLTTSATTTTTRTTLVSFVKAPAGSSCAAQQLVDVGSPEACFGAAAAAAGLTGVRTLHLNNLGFTGCVHNLIAGTLMYGETRGQTLVLDSFQYLCAGPPATAALFP